MIQEILNLASNSINNGPAGGDPGPNGMGPANQLDLVGIGTFIAVIVGIANICLILALIYIYFKNYKQLKTKFTLGLFVFASLLLLQNIVSTLFLALNIIYSISANGFEIGRPHVPLSSINIIQLIALSILLKITWE
jgi:hypothetical protein